MLIVIVVQCVHFPFELYVHTYINQYTHVYIDVVQCVHFPFELYVHTCIHKYTHIYITVVCSYFDHLYNTHACTHTHNKRTLKDIHIHTNTHTCAHIHTNTLTCAQIEDGRPVKIVGGRGLVSILLQCLVLVPSFFPLCFRF